MREECVCTICAHFGMSCGQEECEFDNANFGHAKCPEDCDGFEFTDDEDFDDDEAPDDNKECVECPNCGADAYWTGNCYECEDCGWCGNI